MDNFAVNVPVPHDIPLDLPLPIWLLVGLLVFSFLLHILFVNLMLGGTFLTWWAERKGRENKDYDTLAKEISKTITVNKSIAVVLGVAPLLSINALYTIYFYSANALTGKFWISLVPLITFIFLLLYWHKYSWKKYEDKKTFHLGIITFASILFLFVPFIFLTNMNLMMFPEQWGQISGFWDAMFQSNYNIFARYLHFITASFAVTGLFLFGYMRRKNYKTEEIYKNFSKEQLLQKWYKLTLYASLLQLVFGPLVFFTLPWKGVTWELAYIFIAGILFAITGMSLLYLDLSNRISLGKHFSKVVIAITITVMFMGTGRQTYRAIILAPHQEMVAEKTELFKIQAKRALEEYEAKSNIEQISIQIDKELDRFTRRDLYQIFQKNKEISDMKFILDKQLIEIKYDNSVTSEAFIVNLLNKNNFKIIRKFTEE